MPGLFGPDATEDAAPERYPGAGAVADPGAGLPGQPSTVPDLPAYRVLARKYRPRSFDDLLGQDLTVRILRNAFGMGRVPHAVMLTGVRGVGKTTTARILARCLNCTGPDGAGGPTADPCGVCADCRAILADRHPDVVEMDAASNTGVDDVREIIEATRFRPLQARKKVFVIDEVHMLSRNAFNALLKTLEEPPPTVNFVFATTELRKVPVTVLSRCMRFELKRVPVVALSAHFARIAAAEGVGLEPDAAALLARAADGSVRDGLSLLDQAIAQAGTEPVSAAMVVGMLGLANRDAVYDLLDAVTRGEPARAMALADAAHALGTDPAAMLLDLSEAIHFSTRVQVAPELARDGSLPEAERARAAAVAAAIPMPALQRAYAMLAQGVAEVEQSPDRRATAEMILLRLCYVADLPDPAALIEQLRDPSPAAVAPTRQPKPSPASPSLPSPATAAPSARGNAAVAVAAAPVPDAARAAEDRLPHTFGDAVALAANHEPLLHAQLRQAVHLVRYAPPTIELRTTPQADRQLAGKFAALLSARTGTRWTIALSQSAGDPTLDEQSVRARGAHRDAAADHPLVRAVLEAFPGTRIRTAEAVAPSQPTLLAAAEPADTMPPADPEDPGYDPEELP